MVGVVRELSSNPIVDVPLCEGQLDQNAAGCIGFSCQDPNPLPLSVDSLIDGQAELDTPVGGENSGSEPRNDPRLILLVAV